MTSLGEELLLPDLSVVNRHSVLNVATPFNYEGKIKRYSPVVGSSFMCNDTAYVITRRHTDRSGRPVTLQAHKIVGYAGDMAVYNLDEDPIEITSNLSGEYVARCSPEGISDRTSHGHPITWR